jgi:hypothetical protein
MIEFGNTFELLSWAWQLVPAITEAPPVLQDPFWGAAAAAVTGLVLVLWGARVLRAGFVFAFMITGAMLGKQFAGSMQIDLLIGLVIGAGLAGLIGYAVYRWCLGVTVAAVIALLAMATVSAPAMLDERQAFEDFRLGVGTGQYLPSVPSAYTWTDVRGYFWDQPHGREVVVKSLGPVAVVAMLGFIWSVLAPRLAAILATSILGSALLAVGAGVLIAGKWPETWSRVQDNSAWAIGTVVCIWLFSMMYQLTHPARGPAAAPVVSAPAPTA